MIYNRQGSLKLLLLAVLACSVSARPKSCYHPNSGYPSGCQEIVSEYSDNFLGIDDSEQLVFAPESEQSPHSFEESAYRGDDCKIVHNGKSLGVKDVFDLVSEVVSFIPYVGKAYSIASKVFDAVDKIANHKAERSVDIWTCIKANVEQLVDQKLADADYKKAREIMNGINKNMELFNKTYTNWLQKADPCFSMDDDYSWTENNTTQTHLNYGIGGVAVDMFSAIDRRIEEFGTINQPKLLLPFYILTATIQLGLGSDITRHGALWCVQSSVLKAIKDTTKSRLESYTRHASNVLVGQYIRDCKMARDSACVKGYCSIMEGFMDIVPTWTRLASYDVLGSGGSEIHYSRHLAFVDPANLSRQPFSTDPTHLNHLLFSEEEIEKGTVCTSDDDIQFECFSYISWNGRLGRDWPIPMTRQYMPLHGRMVYSKNHPMCTSEFSFTCYRDDRARWGGGKRCASQTLQVNSLSKTDNDKTLDIWWASYPVGLGEKNRGYPTVFGIGCDNQLDKTKKHNCKNMFINSDNSFPATMFATVGSVTYHVPKNHQIYNLHFTNGHRREAADVDDIEMRWGLGIILEYAPVDKSMNSLAAGVLQIVPGASPKIKWGNPPTSGRLCKNEYIFGGHACYSITSIKPGSQSIYYAVDIPQNMELTNLRIGAYILDDTDTTQKYRAIVFDHSDGRWVDMV
ncbi:hypothetical protein BG000_001724 [Podila horticola]|nr:hypothetical protein BG000_001724 [Podila horticola]